MPAEPLKQRFGRNLRQLRKARGLSQEALAEELGRHRTYVGGLERGERNPSLRIVEELAANLGVDPLELLGEPAVEPVLRAASDGRDPRADAPRRRRPSPEGDQ